MFIVSFAIDFCFSKMYNYNSYKSYNNLKEVLLMKKIICLLLVLACSFAMFSCGDKTGESGVDAISKIVKESSATNIVTQVDYVIEGEAVTGIYTTAVDRASGKSQFSFTYSRYATVEEMNDGYIKTVDGVIWYDSDGSISRDEGDTWEPNNAPAYLPHSLDISEARFASFTISEDGTDLTAEISPAEAKRAFGTNISCEGNITLKIETDGTYLHGIIITYTAAGTASVITAETSYDYGEVDFDFGIEEDADNGTEETPDDGTEDGTDAAE